MFRTHLKLHNSQTQNIRRKSIRTHTVRVIGIGISNLYQKAIVFNIFRINHCRLYSVFRIHDCFQ